MRKVFRTFAYLTVLVFSIQYQAYTQVGVHPLGANSFSVYTSLGTTFPYTDVQASEFGYTAGVGLAYAPLAYLEIAVDLQKGLLQEGHKTTSPLGGAQYKNDFVNTAVVLRAMPIKLLGSNYSALKEYFNISIGGGFAFIKSDVKAKDLPIDGIGMVDNYNEIDVLFPIEFTYAIPVYTSVMGKRVLLGINYRYFYSNTDYLDGYKPTMVANKHNDYFAQTTFSVVFSF